MRSGCSVPMVRSGGFFVIFYGILVGIGNGIYWSCRSFITYLVTNEKNRNYFLGTQVFIVVLCNALIPLLFGTFILGKNPSPVFAMSAYKYTALFLVIISLVAGFFYEK